MISSIIDIKGIIAIVYTAITTGSPWVVPSDDAISTPSITNNREGLEVLQSHILENQEENRTFLTHINCQKQVVNTMCKWKRAGDSVAEVASKASKVSTRKSV